MFDSVADAHEAIAVALEAVLIPSLPDADGTVTGDPEQLRVYRELGENADPPAAYVGPPELTWSLADSAPTEAAFSVIVVVGADDRSVARLYAAVQVAAAALDEVLDVNLRTATPGTWDSGNTTLPCYFLRIEVAL